MLKEPSYTNISDLNIALAFIISHYFYCDTFTYYIDGLLPMRKNKRNRLKYCLLLY